MEVLAYGVQLLRRLFVLGAVLLVIGFIVFANAIEEEQPDIDRRAQGIVVLTGGQARIAEAAKLLEEGKAQRLLISGVHPETSDSTLEQLIPVSRQLFECCIDLDRRARNTMDNATETRNWAERNGFNSLIVVTASYHMPRALVELKRTMPQVELIPYPVTPKGLRTDAWWTDPPTMRLLLTEYLKYIPAVALAGATRLARRISGDASPSAAAHAT